MKMDAIVLVLFWLGMDGRFCSFFHDLLPYFFRCWKVMPASAVHRQTLSAGARFDYWCRVWSEDDHHREQTNQATNLGHGL